MADPQPLTESPIKQLIESGGKLYALCEDGSLFTLLSNSSGVHWSAMPTPNDPQLTVHGRRRLGGNSGAVSPQGY